MNNTSKQLLNFFHLCENLKTEKRHGKTSDNEHDRVASHCWRMAIMVISIAPRLDKKIDILQALKLALIHDLPEVITGDQAYFNHAFDKDAQVAKKEAEASAMQHIYSMLPEIDSNELKMLWLEYEEQITPESRLVKAIDKLEAQIQHNEADISVWNEYDKKYYDSYLDKFCEFDRFLIDLKDLVQLESRNKLLNEEKNNYGY